MEEIKQLLTKYNFGQSNISNSFNKINYVATIWRNLTVSITEYSPNYGRYLRTTTYATYEELKIELENNHKY